MNNIHIYKKCNQAVVPTGLKYVKGFITKEEKEKMMMIVNGHEWVQHIRRKQQHYGITYYQTKHDQPSLQPRVSTSHYPLHPFQFIIEKIKRQFTVFEEGSPNQVLVNQYDRRDSLGLHVENVDSFGHAIVGLSIGSSDWLRLASVQNPQHQIKLYLEDRSLYLLEGEARYEWKHGISKTHEGISFKDESFSRTSFTFRDVIDTRRKL